MNYHKHSKIGTSVIITVSVLKMNIFIAVVGPEYADGRENVDPDQTAPEEQPGSALFATICLSK